MNAVLPSITILLLTVPASPVIAQNQAAVPPDVVKSWSDLIGHWNIEGQIGSAPVTGSATFEWAAGKHCYVGRQTWRVGPDSNVVHLALIGGWDAAEQQTVEQGFSSIGGAAKVRFQPPQRIRRTDVIDGTVAGVSGQRRSWSGTVRIEREGQHEFQLTTTIDGDVVHVLKYLRTEDDGRTDPQ